VNACRTRALELTTRYDVGSGAKPGERAHHGLIGIGLHRITDERRHVGESAGKDLVVARQRRGRIAIERCSDRACERVQIHLLGVEDAIAVSEVVHRTLS
jgi:hypothetical protein